MKQLHLAKVHRSLGAQLIDFAGWEMPLVYSSVVEEHLAVREAVGLFDVSHMGEFRVKGAGAVEFLQRVTSNDVSKLPVGGVQYSTVLNERGGVKDDVMVHRIEENDFLVVCNAVNVEKLNAWFAQHQCGDVTVDDITQTTVLLALQGPKAQNVLQPLTEPDLSGIKRFRAVMGEVAGVPVFLSRSGYTGEDGFELFIFDEHPANPARAELVWRALLETGRGYGIRPCGLGARDTARLEAGLCLYGNELTEDITPLEARIDFVVKFEKGDFLGRFSLLEQKTAGPKRVRVGIRMVERGVPRRGYEIFFRNEKIGEVTSGTFSPLLRVGIAMGYIRPGFDAGEKVWIEVRGRKWEAEIVKWPFYDTNRYGYSRRRDEESV